VQITQLMRYPVKSLAGEALTSVQVNLGGMLFDRSYALVDRSEKLDGKKLTARRESALLSFQALVTANDEVLVRTPAGESRRVDDPAFQAQLRTALHRPFDIERSGANNFHDAHDLLVINAASVRALAREWDAPVNPLRFRPNIIIDGDDVEPFVELQWAGNTLQAGSAAFEGVVPCERCVLTTIDPDTLVTSPDFLALIVRNHEARFGLYCRVREPGIVSVGDSWTICR